MNIQPTDKTDGNVCARNNRISITLNISLSINGDGNEEKKEEGSDNTIKSGRLCTLANPSLSLTIRDGEVCTAKLDSSDPFQHWYKYEKHSVSAEGAEGTSSFALVNKATGQAIEHYPSDDLEIMRLTTFNKDEMNDSVLWIGKFWDDSYMNINIVNVNSKFTGYLYENGMDVKLMGYWAGLNVVWKFVPFG